MEPPNREEDLVRHPPRKLQGQNQLEPQHRYHNYSSAITKSGENSSPPPHLTTNTTATSETPTSSESIRSVSEADQQRPQSATIQVTSSSVQTPVGSSIPLCSAPSDQSPSWNQPPSQLTQNVHTSSNASDLPDTQTGYDAAASDSQYNASSFPSAVKLLVSNNVAGSIIGRSGQTISDLQAQSATRIKLSQAGDYYPGTQDRVCLVQGQAENVKRAVNMLLTRLYALQQQQHYHHFAWQRQQQERGIMPDGMFGIPDTIIHPSGIPGFSFVVRVLVPVPCCGMIIGKGGANVKHMVDSSGVSSIRLSPKEGIGPDAPYQPGLSATATAALVTATAERVVSITGPDLNSCLGCLHIILDGMTSHPDISRYANMTTSYSRVMSASQTSFAEGQSATDDTLRLDQGSEPLLGSQQEQTDFRHAMPRSISHGNLDRQLSASATHVPFIHQSSSPIVRPESAPAFVPFGGQGAPFFIPDGVRSPLQPIQNPIYLMSSSGHASFHPTSPSSEAISLQPSHSAPDLLALHMQNSLRISESTEAYNPGYSQGVASFVQQIPQPTHSPSGYAVQVAVPDNLIGSILGRGGRTLNELQVLSNTRIRISQRGEFVPGTKNRVVTIRGPSSQAVSAAQFLMNQRMVLPPTASTYMERPDYGMGPYPDYSGEQLD